MCYCTSPHKHTLQTTYSNYTIWLAEPCPPNNVQVTLDCDSAEATVSWEVSATAVGYVAFMRGDDGHSLSCHTLNTHCSVDGLRCGTVYYTRVIALGETLNSSDSQTVLLHSGMI